MSKLFRPNMISDGQGNFEMVMEPDVSIDKDLVEQSSKNENSFDQMGLDTGNFYGPYIICQTGLISCQNEDVPEFKVSIHRCSNTEVVKERETKVEKMDLSPREQLLVFILWILTAMKNSVTVKTDVAEFDPNISEQLGVIIESKLYMKSEETFQHAYKWMEERIKDVNINKKILQRMLASFDLLITADDSDGVRYTIKAPIPTRKRMWAFRIKELQKACEDILENYPEWNILF